MLTQEATINDLNDYSIPTTGGVYSRRGYKEFRKESVNNEYKMIFMRKEKKNV